MNQFIKDTILILDGTTTSNDIIDTDLKRLYEEIR